MFMSFTLATTVLIFSGVNLIKLFWHKFTHSFLKLSLFTTKKNIGYFNETV